MADVKAAPALTPAQQIRLESVQLAYRHDRSTEDVIARASALSDWVEGPRATAKGKPKAANGEQVGPDADLI